MIDRDHALPVTRQAQVLGMSRGAVYYLPRPISVADLALMRRIDELHLAKEPEQQTPPRKERDLLGITTSVELDSGFSRAADPDQGR